MYVGDALLGRENIFTNIDRRNANSAKAYMNSLAMHGELKELGPFSELQ